MIALAGTSDLIFDSGTQRIYAAVGGSPGSIVPIDPASGALGTAIAVGIDPLKLARSDDGQFLYVGLDGEPSVQRVDLATQAVSLTIPLGSSPVPRGPNFAEDIAVLPGSPQSIAVSLRSKGISPRHAGVAIFDDDVRRATATPDHTGSNVIEFSAAADLLFGYNNESTEFGFRRMAVDATGVTVTDVFDSFDGDLISGSNIDIRFSGGFIFTTSGRMIDPAARTVVRTFSLPSEFGNFVVPDTALGRVFYLTSESGRWSIRAFDSGTGALVGRENIDPDPPDSPVVNGTPGSLIRFGARGLAFRTSSGQIFRVVSSTLIP